MACIADRIDAGGRVHALTPSLREMQTTGRRSLTSGGDDYGHGQRSGDYTVTIAR